jgi:hypothetical protein
LAWWLLVGGVVIASYLDRAKQFDVMSPLMLAAYASAVLAIACVIGTLRGWRFPFTKRPTADNGSSDQTYNLDRFNDMREATQPPPDPDPGDDTPDADAGKSLERSESAREDESSAEPAPSHGPDTGICEIPDEDVVMPEIADQWPSTNEETDDGFILSVTRPPGETGRLSRCTVTQMEYGRENRWSYVITEKNGLNFWGERLRTRRLDVGS